MHKVFEDSRCTNLHNVVAFNECVKVQRLLQSHSYLLCNKESAGRLFVGRLGYKCRVLGKVRVVLAFGLKELK